MCREEAVGSMKAYSQNSGINTARFKVHGAEKQGVKLEGKRGPVPRVGSGGERLSPQSWKPRRAGSAVEMTSG